MGMCPSARRPPASEPTSPQAHAVRLKYLPIRVAPASYPCPPQAQVEVGKTKLTPRASAPSHSFPLSPNRVTRTL